MDKPTRFTERGDAAQEGISSETWNETEDMPTSYFAPVSEEFNASSESESEGGGVGEKVTALKDKAGEAATTVQEKAQDVTEQAHSMSDKGIDSAAAGLGQAASMLRQQGDAHEGTLGTAASKTADTLEQASTYLQDKNTDQFITDIEVMVRKHPVESVLVAAGIGFVLSKILG